MIDTIIVSGGNIHNGFALDFLKEKIKENDKLNLIAADKGVEFFMNHHLMPDLVVGDFDSLSKEGLDYLDSLENTEVIRLKPEKDDSDTQSAVNFAINRGAKNIVILGATGTRLDHVFANFGLLVYGKEKGIEIALADNNNYIQLLEKETILNKKQQFGKYVSFFPLGGIVKNLVLEGFKYPLNGYDLKMSDSGLTVSNEIKEEQVRISFDAGNLLMIMSRD